jgi:hypothetical protein
MQLSSPIKVPGYRHCWRASISCPCLDTVVARDTREKSLELRALMSLYRLARAGAAAWTEQTRGDLMRTYGWVTEGVDTVDLKEARNLLG